MAKVTVNKYDIIVLDASKDGKRHRLSTNKKSSKRLLSWYKEHFNEEFERLYNHKFNTPPSSYITFKEYGEIVLELTKGNRNQFSQKEETQRFNKLCETFGEMDLAQIKVTDVLQWQLNSGFAPKTIKNYRNIFNQIMELALYDDIIKKNPLKFAKPPKKKSKEIKVFSLKEVGLLISESKGQLKNILLFNFFAGLRGSELIALRWDDIDFQKRVIRVDTRIREGNEDETKSKRVRYLDMLPQCYKALKGQQLITGIKNDFVFVTQYNRGYKTPKTITEQIKLLCKEQCIQTGTLQTMRRTCNTLLKQYGLPNDWILDQMGHVEDGVNREYYTGRIIPDFTEIGKVLA